MKARLNYAKTAAGVYDAMDALDRYLQDCGLERSLLLLTQLYGIVATLVWSLGVTFVLLKVVSAFVPLRVSLQQELEGLDISQHGEALQ